MIPADREWFRNEGASAGALARLRGAASSTLPEDYFALLAFSNGGEGSLPIPPFNFVLYSAEEAVRIERESTFKDFFSGLFVFGGNGGGEAIAFDLRNAEPWPIVYFDMTNIDLEESIQLLAPDFASFARLIGIPE